MIHIVFVVIITNNIDFVLGSNLRHSSPRDTVAHENFDILCTDVDCVGYQAPTKTISLKRTEEAIQREKYCFRKCFSELQREVEEIQHSGLQRGGINTKHKNSTLKNLKLNDALLISNIT